MEVLSKSISSSIGKFSVLQMALVRYGSASIWNVWSLHGTFHNRGQSHPAPCWNWQLWGFWTKCHLACGLRNEDWELYEKAALSSGWGSKHYATLVITGNLCLPKCTALVTLEMQSARGKCGQLASFSLITSHFWFWSFTLLWSYFYPRYSLSW